MQLAGNMPHVHRPAVGPIGGVEVVERLPLDLVLARLGEQGIAQIKAIPVHAPDACRAVPSAKSTDAATCNSVVSNTGRRESAAPINSAISVQPRITACAPRPARPSMTR